MEVKKLHKMISPLLQSESTVPSEFPIISVSSGGQDFLHKLRLLIPFKLSNKLSTPMNALTVTIIVSE